MKKLLSLMLGAALLVGVSFAASQPSKVFVCNIFETVNNDTQGKVILLYVAKEGWKVIAVGWPDNTCLGGNEFYERDVTLDIYAMNQSYWDSTYINQFNESLPNLMEGTGVQKVDGLLDAGFMANTKFLVSVPTHAQPDTGTAGTDMQSICYVRNPIRSEDWIDMFGSTTKVECGKVYYNDSTNNVISPSQDSTNRQKAVEALHTIGSTKYDTLKDFGGDRTITREQAAKFFVSVNSKINPGATTVNGSCTFSDAAQADSTLTSSIMLACQQGIMMWGKGMFLPKWVLTIAEAKVILMRMIVGVSEKEKTEKPWHSAYDAYAGATQLYRYFPMELMTDLMSNENASAKRSHLALFIYRLLEQQNKLP